jgi:hypothetical protein
MRTIGFRVGPSRDCLVITPSPCQTLLTSEARDYRDEGSVMKLSKMSRQSCALVVFATFHRSALGTRQSRRFSSLAMLECADGLHG